jgi:phosphoglycolate phosphatase
MKKYKGIIFDFDGTLADTFKGIYSAWQMTLEKLGLRSVSEETIKSAIGPTRETYLKRILEDQYDVYQDAALDTYRSFYRKESLEKTSVYPGIGEVVQQLRENEISLAIASNKPSDQVLRICEKFGFDKLFHPILGPDNVKNGKPEPDLFLECARVWRLPAGSILVAGDTDNDLIAGKNAGMDRAAVLWGYSDRDKLAQFKPEYFIEKPGDILDIVNGKKKGEYHDTRCA